ncbi:MAG: PIG-L family deacetylase [Candidatus Nanopelagicales bacterium]
MTGAGTADLNVWMPARSSAQRWTPPPIPTLIVAPHPDDETLLCGGLIARQAKSGVPITVLAVTDGEAAYPGDPTELARHRRDEQGRALRTLAGGEVQVDRLRLPDGRVEEHHSTLVGAIAAHLTTGSLLVTPWRMDHHCDHEAVGRAAYQAANGRGTLVAEGLFWTWHHRRPGELPGRLHEVNLACDEQRRRRRALRHHRTQLEGDGQAHPVLHPDVLGPFEWTSEYFILSTPGDDVDVRS